MNLKYNKSFRSILSFFSTGINNLKNTILSVGYIFALSSFSVAHRTKAIQSLKVGKQCCILGNGPSLKDALNNNEVRWRDTDVMCVNMFCQDVNFWLLKPRFYFVSDPAYFMPNSDRLHKLVDILVTNLAKVDWDMYFVTGANIPECKLMSEIQNNKHIKVINVNCTQVSGYKSFRHFIYRHYLGMPRCQTIINMALTSAINMGYNNVFLYGADHSWTKDLRVDDNNVVCYGDSHVYNTNIQVIKKEYNIAFLLDAFAKMFQSHYLIEEYAESRGVKIFNCTKGSFIDAYERML